MVQNIIRNVFFVCGCRNCVQHTTTRFIIFKKHDVSKSAFGILNTTMQEKAPYSLAIPYLLAPFQYPCNFNSTSYSQAWLSFVCLTRIICIPLLMPINEKRAARCTQECQYRYTSEGPNAEQGNKRGKRACMPHKNAISVILFFKPKGPNLTFDILFGSRCAYLNWFGRFRLYLCKHRYFSTWLIYLVPFIT